MNDNITIISSLQFLIIIIIYLIIDIRLQDAEELNKQKDVKVMKVIHDLKNPVTAIMQICNSITNIEEMRANTNKEVEDLMDMLENLRAEFKSAFLMEVNEAERVIVSQELVEGLKRTHSRLAKNGNNSLRFVISAGFPTKLFVKGLNMKRVINNLISNALKHTNFGNVSVTFKIDEFYASDIQTNDYVIGAKPFDGIK